ncbi:acetolactate synthase-1/2/3 large subunit [Prauserella sediminis]|uniref:Acetolactate synthase-1/2/3 large subunit n=1 Tax=Prauserella sediminis TaxID=577680 RepID=A0A839XJ56_9PSEU|nr:thiamine pyrophosphate-binding protein [Prauserella sediminis]MBB3661594.1 acetolactate synthase-1/2/3 large subunit [Prauserella sediminis]
MTGRTGSRSATYDGAWHAIVDFLRTAGVDVMTGLPSDDLALLDALDSDSPRLVVCRDQRNAAFMATGYALQAGSPGVCVVGKGPAATNVMTGVLEAKFSGAPLLVIGTGTATDRRSGTAFQELDQMSVLDPVVAWSERVDSAARLVPALEQAWRRAQGPPSGPVYLELPEQLLTEQITRGRPWQTDIEPVGGVRFDDRSPVVEAVRRARRPILLVGGGTRHRNADGVVERFAAGLGAAVFSTASGRGCFDEDDERFLGLSGLYLRPAAAQLWRDADLVVTLGSRLEETATFGWPDVADMPPVVQVNVDVAGFSAEWDGHRVLGDVGDVLREWIPVLEGAERDEAWQERIAEARRRLRSDAVVPADGEPAPGTVRVARLLSAVDSVVPRDRILVQENGLQDMWSYIYPYYACAAEGGSIVPSEQTSLGFGAAGSGGVFLAAQGKPVVAFVGDGAFAMVRGDLATFAKERLGVLFVVICNGGYGWLQSQLGGHRRAGERFSFIAPGAADAPGDVARNFAEERDVHQVAVTDEAALDAALTKAYERTAAGTVSVVHVAVDLSDAPPGISDIEGDFTAPDPA